MNREESQNTISYTIALWPDWQPTDEEIDHWSYSLAKFDKDSVIAAIRNYKTLKSGSFKKPKLYEVLKHAREFQCKIHSVQGNPEDSQPVLAYEIVCTEHEDKNKIGQRKGFWHHRKDKLPSRDTIIEWAQRACKIINFGYGGKWVIVTGEAVDFIPF